jgi:hypothetical protein
MTTPSRKRVEEAFAAYQKKLGTGARDDRS